jgi:microcystin-dependent protein
MTPFVGQIQAFGFNFAPRGWAKCDGQLLAISQYNALFSLLGTMYGGDGRTTFALPDYRGRTAVGIGTGPGLSNINQGAKGGSENANLTVNNLPAHNHDVKIGVNTNPGSEPAPTGVLANLADAYAEDPSANQNLGGVTQQNVGGSQAFNIRSPFLGIEVCIALEGVYPSRN